MDDRELIERARANAGISAQTETDRLLIALADRLSEREGWREIVSDPPSPGQRIIAATPDGSHWSFCEAFFDEVVEEWTDVRSDRYVRPAHWMPIPSPPGTSNPVAPAGPKGENS